MNGRTSSSWVHTVLSCMCNCQYCSARASGLRNVFRSLLGNIATVLSRAIWPSIMTWATWIPCANENKYLSIQWWWPSVVEFSWLKSPALHNIFKCRNHITLTAVVSWEYEWSRNVPGMNEWFHAITLDPGHVFLLTWGWNSRAMLWASPRSANFGTASCANLAPPLREAVAPVIKIVPCLASNMLGITCAHNTANSEAMKV